MQLPGSLGMSVQVFHCNIYLNCHRRTHIPKQSRVSQKDRVFDMRTGAVCDGQMRWTDVNENIEYETRPVLDS